jgi:hypothetical protein
MLMDVTRVPRINAGRINLCIFKVFAQSCRKPPTIEDAYYFTVDDQVTGMKNIGQHWSTTSVVTNYDSFFWKNFSRLFLFSSYFSDGKSRYSHLLRVSLIFN